MHRIDPATPCLRNRRRGEGEGGLAAVAADGTALGTVVAVDNFGAGDVVEVARPDGKRFMVPMRAEAVPEWNDARLVVADGWAED